MSWGCGWDSPCARGILTGVGFAGSDSEEIASDFSSDEDDPALKAIRVKDRAEQAKKAGPQ